LLKAISALILIGQVLFPTASPGVDRFDAASRAGGNRKAMAVQIGRALFTTEWPAQVLNVYADGFQGHDVAGLRISGVHFHHPLNRNEFIAEVTTLAQKAFAAAPIDEVDIWASVPLRVGKDIVVAGDIAKPTSRTVFSVSIPRGESVSSLSRRLQQGDGVYWDQDWTHSTLK
jgi:hypothetical protein